MLDATSGHAVASDSPYDFVSALDLELTGASEWTGGTPEGATRPTLFGGIVAAQALRAGNLSAGLDRRPHSLHAYFLRAGRNDEPLRFVVDATRDGRSFSARRVEARQSGGAILTMVASFQVPEDGDDYQLASPSLPAPGPGTATRDTGRETGAGGEGPFEIVDLDPGEQRRGSLDWSIVRYWSRVRRALPADNAIHACALVAMGDLRTARPPRAASGGAREAQMTSLDYAVWFHRAAAADQWLSFDLRPGGNGGARGLTYGVVHSADGTQVASFGMEMLLRNATARGGPAVHKS